MGNWMTVNMTGACGAKDLPALRKAVYLGRDVKNWDGMGPLSYLGPSICGLGEWPDEEISAIGNLAERDYMVENVAEQMAELAKVAPSLELTIHCGGDYESKDCVATLVLKDGKVETFPPQIEKLQAIPKAQMEGALLKCMMGQRAL